jgi:glucose/arabinose dehydrogenase
MPALRKTCLLLAAAVIGLNACGEEATLPVAAGTGPKPQLPPPNPTLIPTVNIAPATGWPAGAMPEAAPGLQVTAFADRLEHPRWLHVLPNGDVLVAETDAPPKPEDGQGIRGWVMSFLMKRAGSSQPSANRITLLRDQDGDGTPETRSVFLEGLFSPFGMALVGSDFYVANADALLRFPYREGETRITAPPEKIVDLPAGLNHHWTKSLVASPDGSKLYVGVGSNSNVAENGMEAEAGRAAIWEIDPKTRSHRVFASGLRNPVGMDFEPTTKVLWVAVNERDEIGSDLVPDYMTSVRDGGFYGWPYSYYGQHVDERVQPPRPDLVQQAIVPDYALGPHTASLGLAFSRPDAALPEPFTQGVFVGQHGSWNRKPPSGYKVIFVPFANGKPAGDPVDVLTGFLSPEGDALGRPVGVTLDKRGGLLVADDVGDRVWRVTTAGATANLDPAQPDRSTP